MASGSPSPDEIPSLRFPGRLDVTVVANIRALIPNIEEDEQHLYIYENLPILHFDSRQSLMEYTVDAAKKAIRILSGILWVWLCTKAISTWTWWFLQRLLSGHMELLTESALTLRLLKSFIAFSFRWAAPLGELKHKCLGSMFDSHRNGLPLP